MDRWSSGIPLISSRQANVQALKVFGHLIAWLCRIWADSICNASRLQGNVVWSSVGEVLLTAVALISQSYLLHHPLACVSQAISKSPINSKTRSLPNLTSIIWRPRAAVSRFYFRQPVPLLFILELNLWRKRAHLPFLLPFHPKTRNPPIPQSIFHDIFILCWASAYESGFFTGGVEIGVEVHQG